MASRPCNQPEVKYFKRSLAKLLMLLLYSVKFFFQDAGILSFTFSDDTLVAYILSIGVVKVYRRHGIGKL